MKDDSSEIPFLLVFSTGGLSEQFWRRQGCPLFEHSPKIIACEENVTTTKWVLTFCRRHRATSGPLPRLHRLQQGLRQGLPCSFVGNHEEVQHQHKPYPRHQKSL